MKQTSFKLLSVFTILAMMLAALPMQSAQAAFAIAQWTFESPNTPLDITDTAIYPNSIAPAIGAGNASSVHGARPPIGAIRVGNGSGKSFSSNNWAVDDYYQFSTSTLGYTSISVSWDQTRSSTGPSQFKIAYSTDGTTFTDFGTHYSITTIYLEWWTHYNPVLPSIVTYPPSRP